MSFWASYILVFIVFVVARYGTLPRIGFTLDDWSLLNRAESFESSTALLMDALRHPSRPLGTLILMANYRVYGEHIGRYLADCIAGFAMFLGLGMWLARKLTWSVRAALLFGLLCALWPGYHEMFLWPNIMHGWKSFILHLLLISAWICFLEKGQWRYYLASLFLFAWLAFTYEIYLPVPAALAVLIPWNQIWLRQTIRLMIPFGGITAFYLAYRSTNAFGLGMNMLGTGQHFSTAFAANLWEIRHNDMAILSWFAGPEAGRIWLNGLLGLRDAGPLVVSFLCVLNLGLAWLVWQRFRQPEPEATVPYRPLQVAAFGLAMAAGPALILTLTYPAGRTLFYVAMGIFFVACMAGRIPWRHTSWLMPVIASVMLSTQGMGKNWEVGAQIQRRCRAHLSQHRAEWMGKEILLIDTSSLRERMVSSLLGDPPKGFFAVTEYRSAGFLRGFGPSCLAARVAGPNARIPQVLLDVEHGAKIHGQQLLWHERFNPTEKRETPLADVYVLDMLTATRRLSPGESNGET